MKNRIHGVTHTYTDRTAKGLKHLTDLNLNKGIFGNALDYGPQ